MVDENIVKLEVKRFPIDFNYNFVTTANNAKYSLLMIYTPTVNYMYLLTIEDNHKFKKYIKIKSHFHHTSYMYMYYWNLLTMKHV